MLEVDHDNLTDAEVTVRFNPQIVKDFLELLPKRLRGKTTPWWENPEETNRLD
jgi:hypothetical protein